MEVPRPLKHLVQKVLRGFYSVEHVIVVDLLIRRVVLKEDDMIDLLRFEKKQLRAILALLKNDKLIKFKLRMETGVDGKAFRQNYYYINYRDFVNVVKYKLDHIRKKFELIDRDNTSRASFLCTYCKKSFTDLEVDMLLDITTGELKCTHCGSDVQEDPNHLPKADSRKMLAKFNETMEPLYMLLKEIEDIRLTADLLDPDIDSRVEQPNQSYDGTFATGKWADKKKGLNSFGNMLTNDIQNFNVKIEDSSTAQNAQNQPKKEQPIWMVESTISGANTFESTKKSTNGNITSTASRPIIDTLELPLNGEFGSDQAKEVLEVLLSCEKPNDMRWSKISKLFGFKNEDEFETSPTTNDEDNNKMDWNDGIENVDFFNSLPTIQVKGGPLLLSNVNDSHIEMMSDYEKQDYIRIAQQIYSAFFDI
ncbi:hypothetical protein RDWZM_008727 [Blomia tropicalis]|uniref:HTH TFE/IIEalpha-type domain-containing protein n=1 Tax=Blomia tropicalis TaxID=40697 RepID=A0A9Q0RKM3_BLOTA|nr:General transcription factor IIE subunit 1 [Blomia tropicalis]KAJ6217570.1 hypothetical protein RDWZM_008727 [Blomia tropicalis]